MIPIKYNIGHLKARGVATAMSIFGIGIVIAVMVSMIALHNGVTKATRNSGSKEAMMILREGAQAEVTSWVNKDAYRIIRALPGIAQEKGEPLISPEIVVSFKIPKKDNPTGANVSVRGVTPVAFTMRPYVKLIEGRMFNHGVNEVIVSRRVRDRFVNTSVGDRFQFGPQQWNVVGVFEAPGTAFDSEIWADVDYLGQARKRNAYSSVVLQPTDADAFTSIKSSIQNDNRLKLLVK
ncbi:MAG TPA: ABC transporter permease, partial [Thermoanaerobaculia bacterium]